MTTPAQAAARAENGRRHSTGPRTTQGKRNSSMNATKHGGYAATPVIPHGPLAEDPDAYEAFRVGVKESLRTEGPVEDELADKIASLMWRSRRPAAYEAVFLAQVPMSPPLAGLDQANRIRSWRGAAARVLRDPDGSHATIDLEYAAVAAGLAAGLEMGDRWPQPRPRTVAEWNQVIETTLVDGDTTSEEAALQCDREIARAEAEWSEALAEHRAAEVVRIIENDLLLKTSRVESHLGRELSRHLALLRTLQGDRNANSDTE